MPVNRDNLKRCLAEFDFEKLFIEELLWNRAPESDQTICIGDETFQISFIAHQAGFRACHCTDPKTGKIPDRSIQIKIDTGMTRMGCLPDEAPELITKALSSKNIDVKGIYTHFARADEINGVYTKKQFHQFMRIINPFEKVLKGVDIHCSNSAAMLNFPEFQQDMVLYVR